MRGTPLDLLGAIRRRGHSCCGFLPDSRRKWAVMTDFCTDMGVEVVAGAALGQAHCPRLIGRAQRTSCAHSTIVS
jgi:hypothetical protein